MDIVSAISELSLGGSGGAGGAGGFSSGSSGGGSVGGGWSWDSTFSTWGGYYFADGGYADRPTLGIFGEAGPEYIVPEDDMRSLLTRSTVANMSISAQLDTSRLADELQSAIGKIAVSPVMIPIAFDSEGMRETLAGIIYEILQEVRV